MRDGRDGAIVARRNAMLTHTLKRAAIVTGLYRPGRQLQTWLQPTRRAARAQDIAFYRRLIPQGALCFDVGANIGDKSEALIAAGLRVVAFEPNPLIVDELRARFQRERQWTLVPAAIGAAPSLLALHTFREHGLSSLAAGGAQDWQGHSTGTFHVAVLTLDQAIQTFGVPYFLKLDVEGWEGAALAGLSQPIPLVTCEFHLRPQDIEKAKACLRQLAALGPGRVNIAPAEALRCLYDAWIPLEQAAAWFPGDLIGRIPYGDLLVQRP